MVIVGRRVLLPFLAPPLRLLSSLLSHRIPFRETASFLSATAPTGGFLHCLSRIGKGAINGRMARQKSH